MSFNLIRIICAGILLVVGLVLDYAVKVEWYYLLIPCLLGYILISYDVYWLAIKGIVKGQFFDEHFLMVIATLAAFLVVIFPPEHHAEFPEALAVMFFYQIGEMCQEYALNKSKRSIEHLMKLKPQTVNLLAGVTTTIVKVEDVRVGDIILVHPGEEIPLDGVVLDGNSSLDTVNLTGEVFPRNIQINDQVLSGSVNLINAIKIKVSSAFKDSTIMRILQVVEKATESKSNSETLIHRFAKWYTPLVVIIAILVAIIPPLSINLHSGNVWFTWVGTAVTILIISCPCALVISVPLSFFAGMGVASKHGILMKNANCIEELAKTDIIVFDKTGTLTEGKFQLNEIKTYSSKFEANEILKMVAHLEYHSNHPIAYSIKEAYKGDVDINRVTQLNTFHGEGLTGYYDKYHLIIGNEKIMERFHIDITTCHCTHTHLYVAINEEFIGFIDVGDHIKGDAMETIQTLNSMHIEHMIMLTGDSKYTAADISKQLGIKEFHADLLPEDKVQKLSNIIQTTDNTHVIFVGDGVNDAPVLATANVGIAMGSNGSAVAVEAADVVLMNDKPSRIPLAIKVAKRVIRTARQNIALAICTKLIVLILTLVAGIWTIVALGEQMLWLAVFADVGVVMLAVLNALRIFRMKDNNLEKPQPL